MARANVDPARLEAFIATFPQWDAAGIELKVASVVYFFTHELGRPCVVSADVERAFTLLAEPLTVSVFDLFTSEGSDYVGRDGGFVLSRSFRQYIEGVRGPERATDTEAEQAEPEPAHAAMTVPWYRRLNAIYNEHPFWFWFTAIALALVGLVAI